jgi:hypothetical protein
VNSCRLAFSLPLGNGKPKKILVTPCWGFLAVHVKEVSTTKIQYALALFTLNGMFITRMILPCPVRRWAAWTSRNGFDYILLSDVNNCVYAFEAYYAVLGDPIATFEAEIVGLHYYLEDEKIVVVLESGDVCILPYECDDFQHEHASKH